MIKDAELRKGNLILLNVNYKDNIHRVDEIYTDEIKVTSVEDRGCFPRMRMKPCKPIPLTPEWLERCGFEKRLINNSFFEYYLPCTPPNYRNEYKLRWWDAETFRSLEWVTVESGSIHKFPCAYLHQLQNLYFALTGEELNVKL